MVAIHAEQAERVRSARPRLDIFWSDLDDVEEIYPVDISKGPGSVLCFSEPQDAEERKTT